MGDDQTLPVDINGSCRLPDSVDAGEYSSDSMTAPFFPDKMSPIKALTMKDYENQITALKKENFNLKLRIYFMEERMQQKCDDSTEDIFKTNIELKVELESMKREMAEKQELLVSASKALESLAGRESREPQQVREHAQREMDALRDAFNKRIADLEQSLQAAEEEIDRMAAIAEQEKVKSINMEKQLKALGASGTFPSPSVSSQVHDLQRALQEKDNLIDQLKVSLNNQEAALQQKNCAEQTTDTPLANQVKQLSDLITKRDLELEALRGELLSERNKVPPENQSEVNRLETINKQLTEELTQKRNANETLTKTLEDNQNQSKTLARKLEEIENELNSEKKNALKRDKTIQGLTQVLREKENEIAELCHEIEDRDEALSKAREAAHKAQLQKFQGAEEHQNLLMAKQTELAQLQGEHHAKFLEAQKLQRALDRKEQELADLQQAKDQLEVELEDMQQQKKKGDKAFNDLNNQFKKLSGDIKDRESALEQQYQELLDQTKQKVLAHEVTIKRLTSTLVDKEQQIQEYINMIRDLEQSKNPEGHDGILSKLRQRLKEKEKALEEALDEKFAVIEEKDNEIHRLQLSLREKERDLERLNNLVSHNEDTINSFDSLIKEKDLELQHLENTLKNLQRSKQDLEDNLNRSLREKDSIISHLQLSLEGKTKDLEELAASMLSQSQSQARDLAEQMGQRLKVTEAMLAEAVKARERLVADNQSAVEGLLATINSKDQLLKESAEHYNYILSERTQEIQELRKQLSDKQQHLNTVERQFSSRAQDGQFETAELRILLDEKESLITKLLQQGQERDHYLSEMRQRSESDHVLELRHTVQIMQEKLDEKEAEMPSRDCEGNAENIALPNKTIVVLKKELAQKTEELNKALKRENELKLSIAKLQSLIRELEGHNESQAANIESLTATLKSKDEIINTLHQRFGQKAESIAEDPEDRTGSSGTESFLPRLPQRERTIIGGDSQQEAVPSLIALQQEHEALNRALKAEQQLYSSLVRTVKEQDSAQRLHALQLELTAVQLLRQRLEERIKTNEELRDDLEREIHRAKLREGMDLIDPKELESMRNQLEDAQRWNASLQARLGAIQNRGGGVGGDSLSFIGDQTSYMSICVEEGQDDSLSQLSVQELRLKVLELQDCVSRLHTLNKELQDRVTVLEKSDPMSSSKEEQEMGTSIPWKQQPLTHQDKESQTDTRLGQMVSGDLSNRSINSNFGQTSESCSKENDSSEGPDGMALKTLHPDSDVSSGSHLREELGRLKLENVKLQSLLKEQTSSQLKEKESIDASEEGSDVPSESPTSVETPQTKDKVFSNNTMMSKEKNSNIALDCEISEGTHSHRYITKPHALRRGSSRSRLPVPVRLRAEASGATFEHQVTDAVHGCDQQIYSSDLMQYSTSTQYHHSADSDKSSEVSQTTYSNQSDAPLVTQLELLHQECQEKETLIIKLSEQLADFKELHAQLHEKEHLNRQYIEALQAAESTIDYLTACSLDSQGALGSAFKGSDSVFHNRYLELQETLKEKEEFNYQLIELLKSTDKVLNSSQSHNKNFESSDLSLKIKAALQRDASCNKPSPGGDDELHEHADFLQNEEQNNAEQEEKLQSVDAVVRKDQDGDSSRKTQSQHSEAVGSDDDGSQQRITNVLMNCLNAAESAIASLTAHCTNTKSLTCNSTSTELQTCLDKLKRALDEKEKLGDLAQFTSPTTESNKIQYSTSVQTKEQHSQDPHHNLQVLYKAFSRLQQKMLELQSSQKKSREETDAQRPVHDTKALPPSVQTQLETLHKELRERKKACENLEEKLATAQSFLTTTPCPGTTQKALKQDDKAVQVDLQDLGYETSGKSENDREESSSTDLEVRVKPSCSASSLPSLLKQEQTTLSSTENLYSASSTYPTSPVLSSAKLSLKSLRRSSLSSDQVVNTSDPSIMRDPEGGQTEDDRRLYKAEHGEGKLIKDKSSCLNTGSERRGSLGRSTSDQLLQSRSGSTSPARLESLVQSQARELSQLRQEIRDSRRLGVLHRQQLEDLGRAFNNLMQSAKLDNFMGEEVKRQLDQSLAIVDRLEGRPHKGQQFLDAGKSLLDNDDAALEQSRRLAKELQEKNRVIQTLQSQPRDRSPHSHHSSHSDLGRTLSSCHSSPTKTAQSQQHSADWTGAGGGVLEEGVSGHWDTVSRLQGLQRENSRLQEQLVNSEELNATLRRELDLHRSIMAQTSSHLQEQGQSHNQEQSGPQAEAKPGIDNKKACLLTSDLLAEHLQEIRALRQRLEESIRNNDSLREQLERRLAEVDKDPALTNIFIHDHEQHGQVAKEVQFLWRQNQTLKEQLHSGSRDKQKENEKLRETLARRTAKLEQSRKECETLRQENSRVQERLELISQENAQLQNSLHSSNDELQRLQCEVKLQGQQLSDSRHLLQSLRVELQVYEKLKSQGPKTTENGQSTHGQDSVPLSGSVDLRELLSEIRHLRLQLERSIQTNTALRQKLEEQLFRGPNCAETININYLLSSPDEGGRPPGWESSDLLRHTERPRVIHDQKQLSEADDGSISGSSNGSVSGAPFRLVPGHRMWANRNGRHILGLIEDYRALRKQITEGRKLSRSMDTQLQECILSSKQQGSHKLIEQQHLKSLCTNMNTMQHVLEEASRLLKLVWKVTLPVDVTTESNANNRQDELLKKEIVRLKNRLLQQEKMLSGAVKRLRTTNQLKEGMERVIVDQLSLTHVVLKKARGNLEEIPVNGQ